MKLILALAAALTLGSIALHAQPASCNFCINSSCFTSASCPGDCMCIQPDGPGTEGWCN